MKRPPEYDPGLFHAEELVKTPIPDVLTDPPPKVLIAVLSVRTPPYGQMIHTSKATWDAVEVPGVETIYYVAEPESALHDQVIGFPIKEGYYRIGYKNLLAWKWMLENRDFDFLVRPNASCYVHKPRLLARCSHLPTSDLLYGSVVSDPNRRPWLWGGHQFIMSRDVVQKVVDNPQVWNHSEIEDVALSHAASDLGIPFTQTLDACAIDRIGPNDRRVISTNGNSFHFSDWADVSKLDTQIFFRVKQDYDRHEDAVVMQNLLKYLTP
jgi:hypothetical protein